MKTVAAQMASLVMAVNNCKAVGNTHWEGVHRGRLERLCYECLPRGSGVDRGAWVAWDRTTPNKLVLGTAFHHMDQHGYYAGWTEHEVVVMPDWEGLKIGIRGVDRNGIKEHLHEVFYHALMAPAPALDLSING